MNKLKIFCEPSLETNDHKASILVDCEDWLGKNYIGLDPPMLFRQKTLMMTGGRALIGRCTCGCEGCDDFFVDVVIDKKIVKWQSVKGCQLIFDKVGYESLSV